MQYTIREAKAQLSKLLNEAEQGHDVFVVRQGHRPVRLVVESLPQRRLLGAYKGRVPSVPDSAWDPLSDEESDRFWEGR
jgi:prevent-host-death family protein